MASSIKIPMMGDRSNKIDEPIGQSNHFEVTFHDENDRSFSGKTGSLLFTACSGLTTEVGVSYIGDAQSGMGTKAVRSHRIAGKISFEKSISTMSKELTNWMLDVINLEKKLKKMNLHITVKSAQDTSKTVARWRVNSAWPCSWSGPLFSHDTTGAALETITFVHEGVVPVQD